MVFGEDWGAHPSSTQHLISRLADRYDVLWVNSIGMRRPRLGVRDARRVLRKFRAMLGSSGAGVAAGEAAFPLISPRCISWPGSRLADALNRTVLKAQVSKALGALADTSPILWTSLPTAEPVVGELGERSVVYYCGDDFGALAGVDHAPVLEYERRLVDRTDLILAASDELAARFPKNRTLLLPHGADIDLFTRPAPRPAALPDHPRIAGFYGSFSEWIDREMLEVSALQLRDWHFVFVGPVQADPGALARMENVSFIGPQPHDALPGFVQNWTVSMLPFCDNGQIRACNPLKLREYLAAGTAVASTPFPALKPYLRFVDVCRDRTAFSRTILEASNSRCSEQERAAAVRGESWERRAADVASALGSL